MQATLESMSETAADDRAGHDGAGFDGSESSGAERADAELISSELFSTVELIEAQPLETRAQGYEQLHEQLLAELQRSDGTDHAAG